MATSRSDDQHLRYYETEIQRPGRKSLARKKLIRRQMEHFDCFAVRLIHRTSSMNHLKIKSSADYTKTIFLGHLNVKRSFFFFLKKHQKNSTTPYDTCVKTRLFNSIQNNRHNTFTGLSNNLQRQISNNLFKLKLNTVFILKLHSSPLYDQVCHTVQMFFKADMLCCIRLPVLSEIATAKH